MHGQVRYISMIGNITVNLVTPFCYSYKVVTGLQPPLQGYNPHYNLVRYNPLCCNPPCYNRLKVVTTIYVVTTNGCNNLRYKGCKLPVWGR